MLPSNFIVSSVGSSKSYLVLNVIVLILNVILFSVLFTNALIGGLPVSALYFLMVYSEKYWISDPEYEPSGNSNLSFHVGVNILNLLFSYDAAILFFHV